MYIYIYVCIHIYIYIYIYTCIHMCIYVYRERESEICIWYSMKWRLRKKRLMKLVWARLFKTVLGESALLLDKRAGEYCVLTFQHWHRSPQSSLQALLSSRETDEARPASDSWLASAISSTKRPSTVHSRTSRTTSGPRTPALHL